MLRSVFRSPSSSLPLSHLTLAPRAAHSLAGITLPPPPGPKANYSLTCQTGRLLFVSGHLPFETDGSTLMTGHVGSSTIPHGYQAARQCGLNIVATLQKALNGDLDRVTKIVKVFGIVQSEPDFHEQHKVVDGCSDVLLEIFGKDVAYHARSAIGTSNLPLNVSVEVEAIVEIAEEK